MIFGLSHLATDTSAIFERGSQLYFVERGRDQETQKKKKDRAGGIKRRRGERRDIVSSPLSRTLIFKGGGEVTTRSRSVKIKKGIGWRPQKNPGALSSP
jgi:hypothetical protein